MCTLVLLRRPEADWPLIVAANRDEMAGRPWLPPARHWPDRPNVVAGLDEIGGGSWMGVNDEGVVAAVLNRTDSLGPADGKRTRGELVLDALDYADAVDAAAALAGIDPEAYRPFNLVIADNRDAFWLAHRGSGKPSLARIPDGLHMIAAEDLDDPLSPRIRRYLPRFTVARVPDPAAGDWAVWSDLLGDTDPEPGDAASAMRFGLPIGFGTRSSMLAAMPAIGSKAKPVLHFASAEEQPWRWESVLPELQEASL